MSFVPRDYQVRMRDEARAAMRDHQAVLMVAPTGAGKTGIGSMIALGAHERGKRAMFTVHRDFLVEQTSAAFDRIGLRHGVIANGYRARPGELVQIAAIDTLKHRLDRVWRPDLLVVDESHHSVAAGWRKVIDAYMSAGTRVLGLTATPIRLDGRGLSEVGYSHMVQGPTVRWLIENGFLCDYDAYAPSTVDLSGVHSSMGDFVKSEIEAAVDKPTITGDAIEHYRRLAPGKRAVAFCCSVAHSQHVAEQFNAAGYIAAHIDGKTPREERKRLLDLFRQGVIQVLTSVEIFGEGFDLPAVEVAILLRPTKSLSLHIQQIGRALRPAPGKLRALILDHVGNLMRLGLPDSEFEWTLEGKDPKRGKKAKDDEEPVQVKQCESCYALFWPPPKCPRCGHVHEIAGRTVEQVDGELVKLTPELRKAMAKAKRGEVGKAKSKDELEEIARARGYSNGWADHVWNARERKEGLRADREAEAQLFGRIR